MPSKNKHTRVELNLQREKEKINDPMVLTLPALCGFSNKLHRVLNYELVESIHKTSQEIVCNWLL